MNFLWKFYFNSYGARIGLVQDQSISQQNLIRLLKALKTHLKQKTVQLSSNTNNRTIPNSTANSTTTMSTNSTLANLIATAVVDNNGNKLSMLIIFKIFHYLISM